MKNLAAIPALLVVTAVLAGLALWLLRRAQEKGASGPRWVLIFLGAWLGALAAGAFGARFGYERHYHALPEFWAVYLPAIALAFGAALPLAWWLGREPKPKTPRSKADQPIKPPEPIKLPPPIEEAATPSPPAPITLPDEPSAPELATFKFACPHCGQRLAVTTAEIGNAGPCPNCATPLIVPTPASPPNGES